MIINAIDQKIRNAFSDAAMQYDMLTSLHKEIGRELTKKMMSHEPCERILDIGMGTGWYTKRLTNLFPDAVVIGMDFASGMIDQAIAREAQFKTIQADAAQLPFKASSFDLITSNLAYQWVGDLTNAFTLCHGALTPTGKLCLTMFGYDTFKELFEVLQHCNQSGDEQKPPSIGRLAGTEQVKEAMMKAGFESCRVDSEHIKVRFEDMISLVKWIKGIGANALSKDFYIGKELLNRANDHYNAQYRDRLGVYATFEVIWVEAEK